MVENEHIKAIIPKDNKYYIDSKTYFEICKK